MVLAWSNWSMFFPLLTKMSVSHFLMSSGSPGSGEINRICLLPWDPHSWEHDGYMNMVAERTCAGDETVVRLTQWLIQMEEQKEIKYKAEPTSCWSILTCMSKFLLLPQFRKVHTGSSFRKHGLLVLPKCPPQYIFPKILLWFIMYICLCELMCTIYMAKSISVVSSKQNRITVGLQTFLKSQMWSPSVIICFGKQCILISQNINKE